METARVRLGRHADGSAGHIVAAVRAACADIGCRIPAEEAVREVIGLGLPEAVAAMLPEVDSSGYAHFLKAYRHHFWLNAARDQRLFPGARETLAGLKAAGYRLGVATGKGRNGLDRALREEKLLEIFDVTRCADETLSKPDPRMLMEILEETGTEPARALMIGDTSYDMEMAFRAAVDRLAVGYGAHRPELLLPHGPLGILGDIRELPGWLELARTAV